MPVTEKAEAEMGFRRHASSLRATQAVLGQWGWKWSAFSRKYCSGKCFKICKILAKRFEGRSRAKILLFLLQRLEALIEPLTSLVVEKEKQIWWEGDKFRRCYWETAKRTGPATSCQPRTTDQDERVSNPAMLLAKIHERDSWLSTSPKESLPGVLRVVWQMTVPCPGNGIPSHYWDKKQWDV